MDLDEDILQDFLVEAEEILEALQEQLVELEHNPDDSDLLNAIFRGYHTVKGGAGFLSLNPMVEVCHAAENLFDLLRNGDVQVTPELMDVILEATDSVNVMFSKLQAREELEDADPQVLADLRRFAGMDAEAAPAPAAAEAEASDAGIDEMSADEFEALLDGLDSDKSSESKPAAAAAPKTDGDITDDEFESLLDDLAKDKKASPDATPATPPPVAAPAPTPAPKKEAAPAPKAEEHKKEEKPVATPAETSIRVDTSRLDTIMNMVGELVLVRNRLVSLGVDTESHDEEEMGKVLANLDLVTSDLQGAVMKTRMQPIKKVFGKFPRVVRDISRSLGKEIELELIGEETDLDKNLVEALADPLVHLVRNSLDHGIEMPDLRESNGKPRTGTVTLSASQEGDHILLKITDDGAGMDPEKLKSIAMERGILDAESASRMSDFEAYNLIFMPGFSTKTEISDISGRGVGMDVVKTKITQLNGSLHVDSALGKGSTIEIKVPLTLAIMPTLMIIVADRTFAMPLSGISEIFNLDLGHTNVVNGQLTVIVREKAIPLFYLDEWLSDNPILLEEMSTRRNPKRSKEGHVVVAQVGTMSVGFVVDGLIGQEEVVIKPLGSLLQGIPGITGATITSDGGIALILDVPVMIDYYAKRSKKARKFNPEDCYKDKNDKQIVDSSAKRLSSPRQATPVVEEPVVKEPPIRRSATATHEESASTNPEVSLRKSKAVEAPEPDDTPMISKAEAKEAVDRAIKEAQEKEAAVREAAAKEAAAKEAADKAAKEVAAREAAAKEAAAQAEVREAKVREIEAREAAEREAAAIRAAEEEEAARLAAETAAEEAAAKEAAAHQAAQERAAKEAAAKEAASREAAAKEAAKAALKAAEEKKEQAKEASKVAEEKEEATRIDHTGSNSTE